MCNLYSNKLLVLGAFGYQRNQLDGQTIKTRSVYNLLVNRCKGKVVKIDTLEVKRSPWMIFTMFYHLITCSFLVILPSHNNFTFIFPITYILSVIFGYDIILICIGGRQTEYFSGCGKFSSHKLQLYCSKRIKAFLPEMEIENTNLIRHFNFNNTEVFPNFRKFERKVLTPKNHNELKMVFMGRIIVEKGFPVIFDVLDRLEKQDVKVSMTFWGQIAEKDKNLFQSLIEKYKCVASYNGWLNPENIQQTLSQYDLMLLPTQHYTEGFPGCILDAYIAGIPVIVTEWSYSHEFVNDGRTGFIIPFDDAVDGFVKKISLLYSDRNMLFQMKRHARVECEKYSEDSAWSVLEKYVGKCTNI